MRGYTFADIPDQAGRTVVVTGANSGIGFAAARELARAGARVLLLCRNRERGRAAVDAILAAVPTATLALHLVDLSVLADVRAVAAALDEPIDVLVSNAGIMAVPRAITADGFESQLATNHLGPFALAGLLAGRLRRPARLVCVSSLVAWIGRIHFDDLPGERSYLPWPRYAQTKLANELFVREVHRRYGDQGLTAVACHPGYSDTHLLAPSRASHPACDAVLGLANAVIAQSADAGALPTVYAATAPGVRGGGLVAPALGLWGPPAGGILPPRARSGAAARRLWDVSTDLTGVCWPERLG